LQIATVVLENVKWDHDVNSKGKVNSESTMGDYVVGVTVVQISEEKKVQESEH